MEHYLGHTDYPIWEVIQKGNHPIQVLTDTHGQIRVLPPKTAEEILARKRERNARTTLLMAIPEDHLAKFHKITNAKEMWEEIKSRFDGNDESKKMQKYILKQQFEGFFVSNSEGLHKGYDRFQNLLSQLEIHGVDTLSFDDLYNNLRVFESDVKGSTTSSSSTQNVAFVSSDSTNSTNKDEHKAMVTIDGEGVDWTSHAEDETEDYALMAFHSSNSGLDIEVTSCSKVCEESYAKLKKLSDEQREQLGVARIEIQAYTLALKKVEAQLVSSMEQEKPSCAFINTVKHVKTPRQTVKDQETCSQNHKVDKRDWTGLKSKRMSLGYGYTRKTLKGKGIVDSGCSRHMTGNKAYLAEYQDFNGGPVAFGDSKGQITSKGIKREYSNARTSQQNRVVERKNRTIIKAARTMLANLFLPNTFRAKEVSTACYILNRVLVTKPQNKIPYELITGKIPIISYIRPFGCHVTILNIIDHLGKFEEKSDEGFLVGYSLSSKAFRPVIAENKANITAGLKEANNSAGTPDSIDVGNSKMEAEHAQEYFVQPLWSSYTSTVKSSKAKTEDEKLDGDSGSKTNKEPVDQEDQAFLEELERLKRQEKEVDDATKTLERRLLKVLRICFFKQELLEPSVLTIASYDDEGVVADFTNLESTMNASPIPQSRIHFIHPTTQILGDPTSAV
nr:ribonuclease H-like domain-containing protein [Tanacetum cinerariifolium]